jgi:hypothetical protein
MFQHCECLNINSDQRIDRRRLTFFLLTATTKRSKSERLARILRAASFLAQLVCAHLAEISSFFHSCDQSWQHISTYVDIYIYTPSSLSQKKRRKKGKSVSLDASVDIHVTAKHRTT